MANIKIVNKFFDSNSDFHYQIKTDDKENVTVSRYKTNTKTENDKEFLNIIRKTAYNRAKNFEEFKKKSKEFIGQGYEEVYYFEFVNQLEVGFIFVKDFQRGLFQYLGIGIYMLAQLANQDEELYRTLKISEYFFNGSVGAKSFFEDLKTEMIKIN